MPPFRIEDKEALRRAYVDEGLSLAEIGAALGCSDATVRRALLANGVAIRRSGRAPIASLRDKAWLRAQVAEGRSAEEIAEALGCAVATARAALQWAGLSPGLAHRKPSALDDRGFLEHAYVIEGRSARSIAAEIGSTKDAVLLALRSHRLPVRTAGRRRTSEPVREVPISVAPLERSPPAQIDEATAPNTADPTESDDVPVVEPAPTASGKSRDNPREPSVAEAAEALAATFATVGEDRPPVRRPTPTPQNPPVSAGSLRSEAISLDLEQIEDKTFPFARRGYDREEVDAFLRSLHGEVHALVARVREAEEVARRAAMAEERARQAATQPPASQFFDDVGGRVAAVLESAAEAAEGIKAQAEQEAAALLQQAEEEAEQRRRGAARELADAERARASAEEEAARAVAAAREEAAAVLAAAREQAAEISAAATERATVLDRTVRANVDAVVAEARRDYEHLRALEQQCIDRLASVEFLAKHAKDGLTEGLVQPFDERLERTS